MICAAAAARSGEAGVTAVVTRAAAARIAIRDDAIFARASDWPPGSDGAPCGQALQDQCGHRLAGPRDRLEAGRTVRVAAPGDDLGDEPADVRAGQELLELGPIGQLVDDRRPG